MFEPPADLSNLTEFHTSGRVEGHSLTFNSFEVKVLKSPRPSLVLFHAASCGPSRYSAHVFGQLAAELKEVQVVSYNLSANDPPLQGLARLPSVRLFRNSSWHEYHGRVTRSRVLEWLRQLM
jgi:thiol-disulfide isomerase/thioredoxin